MNDIDVRQRVIRKLENYNETKREIERVSEILGDLNDSISVLSSDAFLDGVAYERTFSHAHSSDLGVSHTEGTISDKTYTCVERRAELLGKREAIRDEQKDRLDMLEAGCERLDRYLAHLEGEQQEILRELYFEKIPLKVVAIERHYSTKTVQRYRDKAINILVSMYKPLYDAVDFNEVESDSEVEL